MVLPHGSGDYYHRYRPRKFSEVVGHSTVIKGIKAAVTSKSPSQAYILSGASGTGKTTTARIIARAVNCLNMGKDGEPCLECANCLAVDNKTIDLIEMNAADARGIDDIRSLASGLSSFPFTLQRKIVILDECQQLSKDAQNVLLKVLEEAPPHVFIILCTTDPSKLLPTVKNRCQQFDFKPVPQDSLVSLLSSVAAFEGFDPELPVYEKIAEAADGCPRQSLVLLQQAVQVGLDNDEAVSSLLGGATGDKANIFEMARNLLDGAPWPTIAQAFGNLAEGSAEATWLMLAGYFRNQVLKAKPGPRLYVLSYALRLFSEPVTTFIKPENRLVSNLLEIHLAAVEHGSRR